MESQIRVFLNCLSLEENQKSQTKMHSSCQKKMSLDSVISPKLPEALQQHAACVAVIIGSELAALRMELGPGTEISRFDPDLPSLSQSTP